MFFLYLLRANDTNKNVGSPCSFLRNTTYKGKISASTYHFYAKGLGRVLKWLTIRAFFCYFRLFILCNKLSTVKGITRVIREVGKLNLANFDVAMLCAVGYAQCKTRELP